MTPKTKAGRQKTRKVVFLKSAAQFKDIPKKVLPWVAFVGRSNAGKSSLINALAGQKGLAKVSQVPGKTKLLNFFVYENRAYWVDMPGYGFARTSQAESRSWKKMIEDFFKGWATGQGAKGEPRPGGVVWIFDIRRKLETEEELLIEFFEHFEIPFCFALNKIDKLNQKEAAKASHYFKQNLGQRGISYFLVSAVHQQGLDALWSWMEKIWKG